MISRHNCVTTLDFSNLSTSDACSWCCAKQHQDLCQISSNHNIYIQYIFGCRKMQDRQRVWLPSSRHGATRHGSCSQTTLRLSGTSSIESSTRRQLLQCNLFYKYSRHPESSERSTSYTSLQLSRSTSRLPFPTFLSLTALASSPHTISLVSRYICLTCYP